MYILKTKLLNTLQERDINGLWNLEYPLNIKNRFLPFLMDIQNYNHHLLIDSENKIIGWAIGFERENETWFSIIVSGAHQKKGLGNLLMTSLKNEYKELNGLVIEHNNYKKEDGNNYISPMRFYLKNGFTIISKSQIEKELISTVKIKWIKK